MKVSTGSKSFTDSVIMGLLLVMMSVGIFAIMVAGVGV